MTDLNDLFDTPQLPFSFDSLSTPHLNLPSKNELSYLNISPTIPFEKRVNLLYADDTYSEFVTYLEQRILEEYASLLKKKGLPVAPVTQEEKDEVHKKSVQTFFSLFFKEEKKGVFQKLFHSDQPLSEGEQLFMLMLFKLLEKYPKYIERILGKEQEDHKFSFVYLLEKRLFDSANSIGKALSKQPEMILNYGLKSINSTDKSSVKEWACDWVAKWLDTSPDSLIQHQEMLLTLLQKAPVKSSSVFEVLLPKIQKLPDDLQTQIWDILFIKTSEDPNATDTISKCLNQYLEGCNSNKDLDIF